MSQKQSVSRKELYRRLWSTPITRLAAEIGYSYTELVSLCSELNIPRPRDGYWYRRSHGGGSEQVPLPAAPPGMRTEIELTPKAVPPEVEKATTEPQQAGKTPQIQEGAERNPGETTEKAQNIPAEGVEGQIKLTRGELYEMVWKRSLKQISEELGTTYVELVRACNELNVPRPDLSYRTKLQLAMSVEITPLSEAGPDVPTQCCIWRKGHKPKKKVPPKSAEETHVQSSTPAASEAAENAGDEVEYEPPPRTAPPAEPTSVTADTPKTLQYTRTQLYNEIWSTPCSVLARKLGLSDVGLAKTCRSMGIPRPPRGYWARLEAGQKINKTPLPVPKPGQDRTVIFNVQENITRREQWAGSAPIRVKTTQVDPIQLPEEGIELHPLSEKHRVALEKSKPDPLQFVMLGRKDLFACCVSTSQVPRLARAMHALICELEDRDYDFELGADEFQRLHVVRDGDRLTLNWTEHKLQLEREPTAADKRKPSWEWQLKEEKPSGRLSIEVYARGLRGKRKWTENESVSLEQLLGIVLAKIESAFFGFQQERIRESAWKKELEERRAAEAERWAREERARKAKEQIDTHERKLKQLTEIRRDNLLTSAQDWIEAERVAAFINSVEERWRQAKGPGELSEEQKQWLEWARAEAAGLNPLNKGYPDPVEDGKLDCTKIPVEGPYPHSKRSRPPPDETPPVVRPTPQEVYVPKQQFPYWLLHRNR